MTDHATAEDPVALGIIGCADIAIRRVLPALARVAGIRLVACASRDLTKAQAVADRFGGEPVLGYDRLLERRDVQAVYVPLPAAHHAEWVGRALSAGKHVLAEKPLTTSCRRSAELVSQARTAGLVLHENYMFVHHSQHRRVRQLLAEGAIGQPRSLTATFAVPPRPPGDIRLQPELGGGALLDVGGYPLRLAQLLLGDDWQVTGAHHDRDRRLGVDLDGGALLRRPDGVTAHLSYGMRHEYTSGYELLGSAGRLRMTHAFTPPPDHSPTVWLERGGDSQRVPLTPDDQCANTLAAFVTAVRAGDVAGAAGPILAHARLLKQIGDHAARTEGDQR
jgi:dTDP-3,4-didehydro-2,6-dideoxy-alpha-D-glucose 3-reductase